MSCRSVEERGRKETRVEHAKRRTFNDSWQSPASGQVQRLGRQGAPTFHGVRKQTVTHNLTCITYGNEAWEDVNIFVYNDSSVAHPTSDGGRLVVLAGRNGSTLPVVSGDPEGKPRRRHRVAMQR